VTTATTKLSRECWNSLIRTFAQVASSSSTTHALYTPKTPIFRNFLRAQHRGLNYTWTPIGSKNAAQLVGAIAANVFEFIFVDDDVCIPSRFRAPTHMIHDVTKGVAFPLKATDVYGSVPLFLVA
jgi:hypothetical protein